MNRMWSQPSMYIMGFLPIHYATTNHKHGMIGHITCTECFMSTVVLFLQDHGVMINSTRSMGTHFCDHMVYIPHPTIKLLALSYHSAVGVTQLYYRVHCTLKKKSNRVTHVALSDTFSIGSITTDK